MTLYLLSAPIRNQKDKVENKLQRWQSIIREAAEQCGKAEFQS